MKALKIILIIVLVLFGAYCIWMATLPSEYHVERSITVNAPREEVYAEVADFQNWEAWSPWKQMDSTMTFKYGAQTSGTGATYTWTSESSGNGSQKFTAVYPSDSLKTEINFEGMGNSQGLWTFTETDDNQTHVSWSFEGEMGFFSRIWIVFMDQMVGPQFENGLMGIKEIAEVKSAENKKTQEMALKVEKASFEPIEYYGVKDEVNDWELGPEFFEKRYGELAAYLGEDFENMTGRPMAIYHAWDDSNGTATVEVAMPIQSGKPGNERVQKNSTTGGDVLLVEFKGPYNQTKKAHEAIDAYVQANDLQVIGAPIEIYVTDPAAEPDTAQWVTQVVYPVAQKG